MAVLEGTDAIVQDLETKISNGMRYLNNVDDPEKKAGAQKKIEEYQQDLVTVLSMDPEYNQQDAAPAPKPALSGNMAVDQANILSNILNSPLYTEDLKTSYLRDYLPGLTEATFNVNTARAAEIEAEAARRQYQADAIRNVAGDYAARGMRTPEMTRRGFAPIQQATEQARTAAERNITGLEAQKELLYGTGAENAETFMSDPTKFGTVGQVARQSAVQQLQQLPQNYGLTQVENANTSPLTPSGSTYKPPSDAILASGNTIGGLRTKIDAAKAYLERQKKLGNEATVAGATKKLQGYESEYNSAMEGY